MPRIVIQAGTSGGETDRVTLSERVTAANLESAHYTTQPIERLLWAAADAEALECRRGDHDSVWETVGGTSASNDRSSEPQPRVRLPAGHCPGDLRRRETGRRRSAARRENEASQK